MSIRLKIILKISVIVVFICAANLTSNLALTQMNLYRISEGEMRIIADMADSYMSTAIDLLKSDAASAAHDLDDEPVAKLSAAIKQETEQARRFIGITVADKKHVIASYGHDAATSRIIDTECAKRAFDGNRVISSTSTATDGVLVFYVYAPMKNGRIIIATVDGMFFSNLIKEFKIWDTGGIFMADKDGTIIANENAHYVYNRVNFIETAKTDKNFQALSDFETNMTKGQSYSGQFSYEGIDRIGVTTPVRGSLMGWTLCVIAPVAESPMMQVRDALLVTALVSFFVCLMIAVIASNQVARPISMIDEQNTRLAELKDEAEFASKTKSSFLANTSHEMRTPLNAIIGLAELTLNEDKLKDEVRENLEKISNSGATLLGIINDLLDISKIESGKFELVDASYDVPSLINDTVGLNIIRIGSKPIEFKLDIDEKLPACLIGDELRIKQIFNNLLSNAFKYTREGEVTWTLAYEESDDETWLVSTVKDSGIGIRPEDIQKLFADYNQVDVRTNRAIEGTGLGLAVVKRLTELMGGVAQIESTYGEGSTFTIRLPQTRETDAIIGKETAENLCNFHYTDSKRNAGNLLVRASLPDASVLIVDDVGTNLDVAKGMMKAYDMKITCVMSGKEAIELIAKGERYDAIFMDHMMPEMDGIEATRIIREEIDTDYARNIPIIALTANAISGNEEMFLDHGFQAFLSKPIDIIRMDGVIRKWIKSKYKTEHKEGENSVEVAACDDAAASGAATASAAVTGAATAGETRVSVAAVSSINLEATFDGSDYGFDIEKGLLRFGGDSEVFLDVLRSYSENTLTLLHTLTEALDSEDFETYALTIHGIKGSSRGICAIKLGDEAEKLEKAAKSGSITYLCENSDTFIQKTRTFIEEIDALLIKVKESSKKPHAKTPEPALLQKIHVAAENFSMDDAEEAIQELEHYDYENGNEIVVWLRNKIEKMEFEEITSKLVYEDGVWGIKNDDAK